MTEKMDPEALRRFVANHQAGQDREAEERSNRPLNPQFAWWAAMELLNFDEELNGDPFNRHDPVSEREDAEVREAWAKLRSGWPRER